MKQLLACLLLLVLAVTFTACIPSGDPTLSPDPVILQDPDEPEDGEGRTKRPTKKGETTLEEETEEEDTLPLEPITSVVIVTNKDNRQVTDRGGHAVTQIVTRIPTRAPTTTRRAQPGTEDTGGDYPDETTPEEPDTERSKLPLPQNNAQIVKFYNSATDEVNNNFPRFKKMMETTVDDISGIEPLYDLTRKIPGSGALINPREEIGKKLGEGTQNFTASQGKDTGYLMNSTLGAGDVSETACVDKGSYYEVTIYANGATNPEYNRNTPLSRFTNDFVSASKARYEIEHLKIMGISIKATLEECNLQSKDIKIVAKIDAYTGQPIAITHTFGFDVKMTNVSGGISFPKIEANMEEINGAGHTRVVFSDFVF